MFGFGNSNPTPSEEEEVKKMFYPLDVFFNSGNNPKTIKSLMKNYNKKVDSWKEIYEKCMGMIERYPNERVLAEFKATSGFTDDTKWNSMTQKEFVLLFAKTMNTILEEEKQKKDEETAANIKARDERLKKAEAEKNAEIAMRSTDQELYPDDPERQPDYAKNAGLGLHDMKPDIRGGSNKKSRKRTTRNRHRSRSRSRRNRRGSYRKYKK